MSRPETAKLDAHLIEENVDLLERSGKLRCITCNRAKGVHLFYKDKKRWSGYSARCKSCQNKTINKKAALNSSYNWRFGISLEEYEMLLEQQGGRCYICRKRPYSRRLAVDHDHELERKVGMRASVRGLLCTICNRFLGHIGDDVEKAEQAVRYLLDPPAMRETGLQ